MISPDGPVYQAGTLSGNPIATTAGIETLKILKEDPAVYERLETKGEKMVQAVREAAGEHVRVNQIGSLLSVFFTKKEVRDYKSAASSDVGLYAEYFGYLLDHGIYTAPSQFEAMFLSDVHTEKEIETTCQIMREALCSLRF